MQKWLQKRGFKIIFYNIVVVFLILLGIEVYLGYQINHSESTPDWMYKPLRLYYHEYELNTFQYHPQNAHYDSTLFYALNPGTSRFDTPEFRTVFRVNSGCFRDDEYSLESPQVIVLGDSYTMGWGVEQHETFAEIIQRKTGKKVLNTGVSSYGTARELESIRDVDMDSLEYMIIQYCSNDFMENQAFVDQGNKLVVSGEEIYNQYVENNLARNRYYPFKRLLTIPGYFKKTFPTVDKSYAHMSHEEAFMEVLKAADFIPDHVHILVFSVEYELCNDVFVDALDTLLAKDFTSSLCDRIHTVRLNSSITKAHRFPFDTHLNPAGHSIVADVILNHLKQNPPYTGVREWYYPNGKLCARARYRNGIKDGPFITYWENGQTSRTASYTRGVQTGIQIDYNQSGEPKDTTHFPLRKRHEQTN